MTEADIIVQDHSEMLTSISTAHAEGHINSEEAFALGGYFSEEASVRLDEYFDAKWKRQVNELPFFERWFNRICDRFGWLQ